MPTPFPYQIYMNAVPRYTKEVQIELTCRVTQCDTVAVSLQFERFRDFYCCAWHLVFGSAVAIVG